jgi:hypothetical protein
MALIFQPSTYTTPGLAAICPQGFMTARTVKGDSHRDKTTKRASVPPSRGGKPHPPCLSEIAPPGFFYQSPAGTHLGHHFQPFFTAVISSVT